MHKRLCLLLCGAVCVVSAETVYLTAYDSGGKTFSDPENAGAFWGGTPVTSENDYVIGNKQTLRTVDNNTAGQVWTFVGNSLTLKPGGTFATKHRNNTVVVPRFTLEGGNMAQHNANGTSNPPRFEGTEWRVTAPESSPVTFTGTRYMEDYTRRGFEIAAPLSGSGAITVGGGKVTEEVSYLSLVGDNRNYTGTVRVNGAGVFPVALYLKDGTSMVNLALSNKAVLGATADNAVIASDRVLNIETTGAALDNQNAANWTLSVPVSGEGVLEKVGNGTITLRNQTFSAAGLNVLSGTLALQDMSFADGSVVTFAEDTVFEPGGVGTTGTVSGRFDFAKEQRINFDYDDRSCDRVELLEGSVVRTPLRLFFRTKPADGTVVMTVPVSAGVLTADDFRLPDPSFVGMWQSYRVETADGIQSVIVESSHDYIELRASDGSNQSAMGPANSYTNWSDGQKPHADARYVVLSNLTIRTPVDSQVSYPFTFPGRSITFGSPTSDGLIDHRSPKTAVTVYPEAWLIRGTYMNHTTDNSRPVFQGNFHVWTTLAPANAFYFTGDYTNRGFRFECALHGPGRLWFKDACAGEFAGDNRDFTGKFYVDGRVYGQFRTCSSILFESDASFGASPDTMMEDAVTLHQNGTLCAKKTQTLAPVNRGIKINDSTGRVDVVTGAVLTFASQISAWGPVTKVGGGDFVVGGKNIWRGFDFNVTEGGARAGNAYALSNAMIRVYSDACLSFALDPEEEGLSALGLAFPAGVVGVDDRVNVRLTGYTAGDPARKIALFSLEDETKAVSLCTSLNVTLEKGSSSLVTLSVEPAVVDGLFSVMAEVAVGGSTIFLK